MQISIAQKDPRNNLEITRILNRWQMELVAKIISYTTDPSELVEQVDRHRPELIITDIDSQIGVKAISEIRRICPSIKILVYSQIVDVEPYLSLIDGYCHSSNSEELLTALNVINKGAIYWDKEIKQLITKKLKPNLEVNLSAREREILQFLSHGKEVKQIAKILGLSVHTINNYIQKAMNKFDVHTRTEMIAKAIRHRIISQ